MAGSPTDISGEVTASGKVRWSVAFWGALLATLVIAVTAEWRSPMPPADSPASGWWAGLSPDWRPFIPILLLAIPLAFLHRPFLARTPLWWRTLERWGSESCPRIDKPVTRSEAFRAFMLSLIVAAVALLMSWHVSHQFGDLPPAYHDEFSYLFQAKTFLAGRVFFPSHPEMPELFNQMHVLNEGHFASRYFPGVGLWMMPFVALGNPWWGHWAAHAAAAFLLFWIGRHLGNNAVGFVAGLLLAVSPGVALFSNLLLAHHPTLVGLLVFVITFLKLRRAIGEGTSLWGWALLSGCGLTFAMLCRPMTAAGIGLPFGIWFGWWVLTGRGRGHQHAREVETPINLPRPFGVRLQTALAMGLPIVCGFAGLFAYNQALTDDGFVSPYQQYTDIYTPRHVYGFNNVIRGERHLGPKVLTNYDVWAENLTPELAAKNVGRRIMFSFQWTLGIVPLSLVAIVFLLTIDRWNGDWWLTAAAIVSLHAVHIPYWFEGIMGWHYVFESAPFWLLIVGGVTWQLWRRWEDRSGLRLWWCLLAATSLGVNLVTIEPLWPARLDVGITEVAFSRQQYAEFFDRMERLTAGRRSLVLIKPDPADRHIDYVVNGPALNATILYGRYTDGQTDIERVIEVFPGRDVWLVDIANGEIEQLSHSAATEQEPHTHP